MEPTPEEVNVEYSEIIEGSQWYQPPPSSGGKVLWGCGTFIGIVFIAMVTLLFIVVMLFLIGHVLDATPDLTTATIATLL